MISVQGNLFFFCAVLVLQVFHLCTCYMIWYCPKLLDVLLCFIHSFFLCYRLNSITLFFVVVEMVF